MTAPAIAQPERAWALTLDGGSERRIVAETVRTGRAECEAAAAVWKRSNASWLQRQERNYAIERVRVVPFNWTDEEAADVE